MAVAAVAAGVGVLAYATHLLRRTELQSIDARFSIRGSRHASRQIVLVLIDDATFAELTREHLHSEFPFPRRYEASVIDNLRKDGARTIALDIEFAHPTDAGDDNALFEALASASGKTVLAATEVGKGGSTEVLGGAANQHEAGARVAEALLKQDTDGSVRRFAYSFDSLQSFPVVTAEVALGHPIRRSRFEDGLLPIDFAGGPGSFPAISFAKVRADEYPRGMFAGKTVIVGASAPVLQDVHTTATSGSQAMAGPEIMADATATLLEGVPLRDGPGWLNVLLAVLLGLAAPLGGLRVRRWRTLLDAALLAAVFAIAVQVAFDRGLIVSVTYPLLALAFGTLGTLAVLYVRETIERERVRDVFARFVARDVVDRVLENTDENLRLGGMERECTVLFSDLRGFTRFSSTQPAARVIDVINFYLNEMTDAILRAGGTLITYMGDGIMAVFGAPLELDDHADRAVVAAQEMLGPRLARFNEWLAEEGFGHRFEMGIGINTGTVMAGNVGSEQRIEYAAIGDTTNTASRLEGMTKDSDASAFISASTRERMRGDRGVLKLVGSFEVRGRDGSLEVWTLAGAAGDGDARPGLAEEAADGDGAAGTASTAG
ncbi:MAG TPA: adenylate/guanylate cyclase domain-containing protein [Solirubrobacteraceae bacterium]|nr:adenylate/guanylate cyclase domain-containing protein [Solirubrobacteraceae bacterium]